jgi:hypothetical protein
MDWLEQELKQALERKAPSPDFAARVAAAAAGRAAPRRVMPLPRPVRMLPRWLPVAAAVLLIAGGAAYREHQGRVAKEQVMLAMRITAGKLNHIQVHMKEARP